MQIVAIGLGTYNKTGEAVEFFYLEPFVHTADDQEVDFTKIIPKANEHLGIAKSDDFLKVVLETVAKFEPAKAKLWSNFIEVYYENNDENHYSTRLVGKKKLVLMYLNEDLEIQNVSQAYLKLHLISYRFFKPGQLNLTNLFNVLPKLVWTNLGPIGVNDFPEILWKARVQQSSFFIRSIDKFPPLTDYLIPHNVRIADTARIRLGAYLGEGTTVMHEGFINFNAGTAGPNMIEGRISAGVFVNKDSDLGGGSSTMGMLSGGGNMLVSIGKNCLIGANAGLGIPLGDNCIVEAGLYLTASSKVKLLTKLDGITEQLVKARDLIYRSNLLFRRNSQSGSIECLLNTKSVELNPTLHLND